MRITYPTSRNRPVITLGRAERALWQKQTADARDVDAARRAVLARVRSLITAGCSIVEVYAPAEGGGHLIDQHVWWRLPSASDARA